MSKLTLSQCKGLSCALVLFLFLSAISCDAPSKQSPLPPFEGIKNPLDLIDPSKPVNPADGVDTVFLDNHSIVWDNEKYTYTSFEQHLKTWITEQKDSLPPVLVLQTTASTDAARVVPMLDIGAQNKIQWVIEVN